MIYSNILPFLERSKFCEVAYSQNFDLTQIFFPLQLTPELRNLLATTKSYYSDLSMPLVFHVKPLDIYVIAGNDPLYGLQQLSRGICDVKICRIDYSNVAENLTVFTDKLTGKLNALYPQYKNSGETAEIQNSIFIDRARNGEEAEEEDFSLFSLSPLFSSYESASVLGENIEEKRASLKDIAENNESRKEKVFKLLEEALSFTGNVESDSPLISFLKSYLLNTGTPPQQIPLLEGNTALAKSSVVQSLAKELGFRLVDVRAAFMLPLDFKGLSEIVAEDNQTFSTNNPSAKLMECTDDFINFARSTVGLIKEEIQSLIKTLPSEFSSLSEDAILKLDISTEDEKTAACIDRIKNLAITKASYEEKAKPPILFLDEFTRALPIIQNAFFTIFTDKVFAGHKMTYAKIIAATNAPVGIPEEVANAMFPSVGTKDPANLARYTTFSLTESDVIPSWLQWAVKPKKDRPDSPNIFPALFSFLQKNPRYIYDYSVVIEAFKEAERERDAGRSRIEPEKIVPTTPFPNFRTWEMVSDYLYRRQDAALLAVASAKPVSSVSTPVSSEDEEEPTSGSYTFERSDFFSDGRLKSGSKQRALDAGVSAEDVAKASPYNRTFPAKQNFSATTPTGRIKKSVRLKMAMAGKVVPSSPVAAPSVPSTAVQLQILPLAIDKLVGPKASNAFLNSGILKFSPIVSSPETAMTDIVNASLDSNTPLLLGGSSSLGKSARVKQWAEANNAEVYTIILSQSDPALLMGKPDSVKAVDYMAGSLISNDSKVRDPKTGSYDDVQMITGADGKEYEISRPRYAQSSFEKSEPELYQKVASQLDKLDLPRQFTSRVPDRKLKTWLQGVLAQPNKIAVLFFDEVNRVQHPAIMSAVFEAISDHRFAGVDFTEFKDRVRIVAACNLKGDVEALDSAFGARFMTFTKPFYDSSDVKAFMNYTEGRVKDGKFSPALFNFLKSLKKEQLLDYLSSVDNTDTGEKYDANVTSVLPSSRSFSVLSDQLMSVSFSHLRGSLVWADNDVEHQYDAISSANFALAANKAKLRDLCDLVNTRLSNWTELRPDPNGQYDRVDVGKGLINGKQLKELWDSNYNKAFTDASVPETTQLESCDNMMVLIRSIRSLEQSVEEKRNSLVKNTIGSDAGGKFLEYYNPLSGMDASLYGIEDLGDISIIPTYWKQQYVSTGAISSETERVKLVVDKSLELVSFWKGKPEFTNAHYVKWMYSLMNPIPTVEAKKDAFIAISTSDADYILMQFTDEQTKAFIESIVGTKEVSDNWAKLLDARKPKVTKSIKSGNLFPMDEAKS